MSKGLFFSLGGLWCIVAALLVLFFPGLTAPVLFVDAAVFFLIAARRKSLGASGVLLPLALIVALFHAECGFRADSLRRPDRYFETEQEAIDRWRVFEHTNLAGNQTPEKKAVFRTRRLAPADRPEGTLIVALGSSSTFGEGVLAEQAWPFVLEEELGPGATVLNAGVSGYNLFQLWIYFRDVLSAFAPDAVIFFYGANEGINEEAKTWYPKVKKRMDRAGSQSVDFRKKAITYGTGRPAAVRLLDILHKSYVARRAIRKMRWFADAGLPRVEGGHPQPKSISGPPYTDDVLKRLSQAVVFVGAKLIFVPEPSSAGSVASPDVARMMKMLADSDDSIFYLDISRELVKKPEGLFLDFVHPAPLGHRRIGSVLAGKIDRIFAKTEKKSAL